MLLCTILITAPQNKRSGVREGTKENKTKQQKKNNKKQTTKKKNQPKNNGEIQAYLLKCCVYTHLGNWLRERLPAPSRLGQLQAAVWQTDVTGLMGRALQEGSEGGNELRVAGPHPAASSLLLFSFYRLLYLLLGMRCHVPRQTWAFLFFFFFFI